MFEPAVPCCIRACRDLGFESPREAAALPARDGLADMGRKEDESFRWPARGEENGLLAAVAGKAPALWDTALLDETASFSLVNWCRMSPTPRLSSPFSMAFFAAAEG